MEYYDSVVSYVINELQEGHTPSPDIFCNQRIKFDAFFHAINMNFDRVVTGHYARIQQENDGLYHLFQAPDPVKDQSYFLSQLNQDQLSQLWFPLGNLHKSDVRALAADLNLPNKDRRDSQGICFLGNIRYPDFIRHYLGKKSGAIIRRETGESLGIHDGFWFYTIGQRTGLGLSGGPWYVVNKDCEKNIVYVSHQQDIEAAFHNSFTCTRPHWIRGQEPLWLSRGEHKPLQLKLRHGPKMISCFLKPTDNRLIVHMEEGDRGIAPGQFAVFYDNDECLGSAMIEGLIPSPAETLLPPRPEI